MIPPHSRSPAARRLATMLGLLLGAVLLLGWSARSARAAEPAAAAAAGAAESATGPADTPASPTDSVSSTGRVPTGYTVGPGDTLFIQVYGEDGLTGPVPVSDTGAIDFPLLGAVQVAGLSPREVAELLRRRLADGYLVEPQVTVRVESFGSQPIQVLGAVAEPGVYYVRGATTVLEMLTRAGGVRGEGVNEVRVTRVANGGQVQVLPYVDLVSEGRGNIEVRGGDLIFVPESLVYVMGEVQKPGPVPYRDQLTVSRCIAAAGGAADGANLGRVWILRGDTRIRVNVRRILKGKAEDVPVEAGDQIFVQESVL